MMKTLLLFMFISLYEVGADEELTSVSPLSTTTLGKLLRQARSEYHSSRYGADSSSVTSGSIGIRGEPEHRDAAYYESRCITCDPNKSTIADRGWRNKPRYDYYDEEAEERRHRYRYDDYIDRGRGPGYDYERPRGSSYDYDRSSSSSSAYDYDPRMRGPMHDYDRYDAYGRMFPSRPLSYADRYDMQSGRDRYNDMRYERNYDRYSERGNGYDNLEQGYLASGNRYDPYNSPRRPVEDPYNSPRRPADDSYGLSRRPVDDPYMPRYDRYNNNYINSAPRYDPYDRYEPYERSGFRRPYDDRRDRYDRYDRNPFRGGPDSRGYFSAGYWGPGYERGYASAWNYAGGHRDNWREPGKERDPSEHWKDLHRDRDRDVGQYRPRDYFDDSTAQPGGLRGTSYRYDRPESSTKPDSTERDKPTSSPQTQDNKVYKD